MTNEGSLRVATLTLSDSRTTRDDEGGRVLQFELERAGCALVGHALVREEHGLLRAQLETLLLDETLDAIVTTGGTGVSPRDRTLEELAPLFDKTLDGFGEAFRRLSWDAVGPKSILSRAAAGIVRGRVVAALPGSVKAVELAVRSVLGPILPHACALARGRTHGTATLHDVGVRLR